MSARIDLGGCTADAGNSCELVSNDYNTNNINDSPYPRDGGYNKNLSSNDVFLVHKKIFFSRGGESWR